MMLDGEAPRGAALRGRQSRPSKSWPPLSPSVGRRAASPPGGASPGESRHLPHPLQARSGHLSHRRQSVASSRRAARPGRMRRSLPTRIGIPSPRDDKPRSTATSDWDIVLTTDKGIDAIKDVFIFVEDQCEVSIDRGERQDKPLNAGLSENRRDPRRTGGCDATRTCSAYWRKRNISGQMLVEKGVVTPDAVESALVEQQHVRKIREKAQAKEESISSIRVPSEKLDILVNLIGELVTAQARLTQDSVGPGR